MRQNGLLKFFNQETITNKSNSSSETPQNKNTTSSSPSSSTRPQFQRGDDSNPDYYPNRNMYRNPHQEINPYSIGSSDLDPFGQGGK